MTTNHALGVLAALVLAGACLPALAHAAEPEFGNIEITVSTADLDLTTAAGVATLKQRLRSAAKTVCLEALQSTSPNSDSVRACRLETDRELQPAMQSAISLAKASQAASLEASAIPR